jgi:hypothetical protein
VDSSYVTGFLRAFPVPFVFEIFSVYEKVIQKKIHHATCAVKFKEMIQAFNLVFLELNTSKNHHYRIPYSAQIFFVVKNENKQKVGDLGC